MFKVIKEFIAKKLQEQKAKQDLQKAKRYYTIVKEGRLFLNFVQADLKQLEKNQVNRDMRKRFRKSLQDFELNEETIQYFATKIDKILDYINAQLKPKPKFNIKNFLARFKKPVAINPMAHV